MEDNIVNNIHSPSKKFQTMRIKSKRINFNLTLRCLYPVAFWKIVFDPAKRSPDKNWHRNL